MCGRYTLVRVVDLHEVLPDLDPEVPVWEPRYNLAPGQDVLVTANHPGRPRLEKFRWGLVPAWAKDPAIGNHLINARAESVADKPSFRQALERRRCLVWADGFYEWQKHLDRPGKTPLYIRMKDRRLFAFAGLWERWRGLPSAPELFTCTIITTVPNALMAPIHDRMPVILPPATYAAWLDPRSCDEEALRTLLRPFPADAMEAYAVSPRVNTPANEGPALIEPVLVLPSEPAAPIPRRRQRPDPTGNLFGDLA